MTFMVQRGPPGRIRARPRIDAEFPQRRLRCLNAMTDAQEITVVLADDHAVVRSGLRLVLEGEDDMRVVAEAGTVDDAVRLTKAHRPSVLVLDINMPGGPGSSSLDVLPQLTQEASLTRVVILTMQEDPQFARRALGSGATA